MCRNLALLKRSYNLQIKQSDFLINNTGFVMLKFALHKWSLE